MQRVAEQLLAGEVGSGWNWEVVGTGLCWGIWDHLQRCFSRPCSLALRPFWESSGSSTQLLHRSLKISLDKFERSAFPWDFWDSWLCMEQDKGCYPV